MKGEQYDALLARVPTLLGSPYTVNSLPAVLLALRNPCMNSAVLVPLAAE
jgi:hypothetical protein